MLDYARESRYAQRMGLKLSNYQLKLLLPIVVNAAREKPDLELDVLVDRLIEMAKYRGMTMTRIGSPAGDPNDMQGVALEAEVNRPERVLTTSKPERVYEDAPSVHPLFRDVKKPRKNSAA